jgi:hypothetical protein
LHSQTNHSDGGHAVATCEHVERPHSGADGPARAYEFARAEAGLDFLLTSDHNHVYDGQAGGVKKSARATAVKELFQSGLRAAAEHRRLYPSFVALYGTEFGVIKGGGHINILNPTALMNWEKNEDGELLGDIFVEKSDYRALYVEMESRGWIGQFNHPDTNQFAIDGVPYAYDELGDQVMALCEVANAHAFSSSVDEEDVELENFEGKCRKLLLAGYHVAFSSNQDNHCSNWGLSAPNRTGVLIEKHAPLGEATLLEAIRARRVFATEDKRSSLVLLAAGRVMGARFEHQGPLAIEVMFRTTSGESLEKIEIFHGRPGETITKIGDQASVEVTPPRGRNFYFARVEQTGGARLWSAPIWIESP